MAIRDPRYSLLCLAPFFLVYSLIYLSELERRVPWWKQSGRDATIIVINCSTIVSTEELDGAKEISRPFYRIESPDDC